MQRRDRREIRRVTLISPARRLTATPGNVMSAHRTGTLALSPDATEIISTRTRSDLWNISRQSQSDCGGSELKRPARNEMSDHGKYKRPSVYDRRSIYILFYATLFDRSNMKPFLCMLRREMITVITLIINDEQSYFVSTDNQLETADKTRRCPDKTSQYISLRQINSIETRGYRHN